MNDPFNIAKKKDRGWGFDSDDAVERSNQNLRRKGGYTKKGERPGKNWKTLGIHTGVGAGIGAGTVAGMTAASDPKILRSPKYMGMAAGAGAAMGAVGGAVSGAATNEYRASEDAHREAVQAGDYREARKGERASEYHGGVIVPKKKYKKAQFKAMQAENQSLKERLSTVNKSAFGVTHPDSEVAKAFAFKPIANAVKGGVKAFTGGAKGAQAPFKPKSVLGAAQSAGQGVRAAGAKAQNFAATKPKTTIGIGAGTAAGVTGVAGYKTGQRRSY